MGPFKKVNYLNNNTSYIKKKKKKLSILITNIFKLKKTKDWKQLFKVYMNFNSNLMKMKINFYL